jgi:hypothetical protein
LIRLQLCWFWPSGPDQVKPSCFTPGTRRETVTNDLPHSGIIPMFFRALFVFSTMLLLTVPSKAADCPVPRGGDDIATALEKAPTCADAQKVFEACAYVASIDSMFGGIVTEKCEKDFLTKLSGPQRRTYDREKDTCTKKYARKEGTMYISFMAMCHSKLAVSYSKRFARK